eukprot:scaffold229748_cov30-Tisochrysis_lutea.AAC.5
MAAPTPIYPFRPERLRPLSPLPHLRCHQRHCRRSPLPLRSRRPGLLSPSAPARHPNTQSDSCPGPAALPLVTAPCSVAALIDRPTPRERR